ITDVSSQPQPTSPTQMPLDPTVITHDAADASADLLVEHRLPRNQAEPKPVFDHSVAPAGEVGRARQRTAHVPALLGGLERHAAALRHSLADPFDFLPLQCGDEVARQAKGSIRVALCMASLDKLLGAPVESPRHFQTEP